MLFHRPLQRITVLATAAMIVLLSASGYAEQSISGPRPVKPGHVPQATTIDTRTPARQRALFSQQANKSTLPQFQDEDLTDQVGKAGGPIVNLSPEQQIKVNSLTDPLFLRKLKNNASQRANTVGGLRSDPSQRDLPWTPDQLLANPTNMNDEYVSLAESPLTGRLYAVFAARDLGGTDRDIHIAQSNDQGTTWTVNELPSFSQDEYQPELAIDAGGYIHVTWIRADGYILRSRTAGPDDTANWAWVRGLGTSELCATPAIAVSGSGDFAKVFIVAAWSTINYDLYAYEWTLIFMNSSNGGQTIEHDYFLTDGYEDYWPDVAMDGGLVHMVNGEVDYDTGETEILIASDAYNGGFSDPAFLTSWTPDNCGFPSIACQNDDVFIVYQNDFTDGLTTDGDIIYTYSWDAGSSFFGPFGLIADEYESVGPSIFTRDGVVGALWLDAPPNADEFYLAAKLGGGFGTSDAFGEVEQVSEAPRVEPAFHSAFGVATDNLIHAAWVDRRDFATQGHNIYTSARAVLPNLGLFTPADWDTSLVANMVAGQRTQGWLEADGTTYISFAFMNDGLADIGEAFNLSLKLDGTVVGQWSLDDGLETGTYVPVEDYPLTIGEGSHTLTVSLDNDGHIAESDETDNILASQFIWIDGEPSLRFNPAHLVKTITVDKAQSQALALIEEPALRHEYHLPVIDARLSEAMNQAATRDRLRVMIVPAERLDPRGMSLALSGTGRATRREVVIEAAKLQTQRNYTKLKSTLEAYTQTGQGDAPQQLWLSGSIVMELSAEAITDLAQHPDVGYLWLDDTKAQPTKITPGSGNRANAWHIETIGADQAWSMELDGRGVLIGHLDTGIAYDHPDLAGQMWDGGAAWPNHGYDSVNDDNDPYDGDTSYYHGTHTSGLIAGDGSSGSATGAAPGATIMALRCLPGYLSDMVEALQFGLDNGVDLFSLSGGWQLADDATREANRYNAELLLSIDLPWICAGGNGDNMGGHHPVPRDIPTPADCPGPAFSPSGNHTAVLAVGSIDEFGQVSTTSSYGPTAWDLDNTGGETDYHDYASSGLMKPDVTAPGVDVVSCFGGGGYVSYSGTSMSCPLVSGMAAILWQAAPDLTWPQLAEVIENTATDISVSPATSGRDNYTGAGLVNIIAALDEMPTAEPEFFWICNDGQLPLNITEIATFDPWLEIQDPGGAIAPGDSVRVTALLDPNNLSEGLYNSVALVLSNDPQGPHEYPVTLIYGEAATPVEPDLPMHPMGQLTNHPNPFNPKTMLQFSVPGSAHVDLLIYDLRGRQVCRLVDDVLVDGPHSVAWHGLDDQGRSVASGPYFARLKIGSENPSVRKLMLVR